MNGKLFLLLVCATVATANPIQVPDYIKTISPDIREVHIRRARQAPWIPNRTFDFKLPIATPRPFQMDWIPNRTFDFKLPIATPRPFQIISSGGGSIKKGLISIDTQGGIWKSANQQHAITGTAGFTQQYGVPSRPDYRAGIGYTYTFG